MRIDKIAVVFSAMIMLAACQSVAPDNKSAASPPKAKVVAVQFAKVKRPAPQPGPPTDLWDRIRRGLSWQEIESAEVDRARNRFLGEEDYLPGVAGRASLYLYYIVDEVERRGLPMEVALLPLVESTLNPFAYSPMRAAGLWQFMPATARNLGVERNWWYDGRRDLRESTRAALDYLEALNEEFDGDWLLALAAYNAGNGRVGRAVESNRRKGRDTDYWSLALPRETRRYIPKLIALSQIIATPDAFGVEIPTVPNEPAFEIGYTGGQIQMARAADLAGVDVKTLRALNPGQLRWATSPDQPPELLLPTGAAERFAEGVAGLSANERMRWRYYRIESGDSLVQIARKFGTDVGLLRRANGLRDSMIRAGDTLMIPDGAPWSDSLALAGGESARPTGYRVRRGDSLYGIADRFNVSINDIVDWNSLDPGAYLQPGQKLTLYIRGS